MHKREVVGEGGNGEEEEADKGGRKEEKIGGEGEKEETDCKTFLWLGEPAPPPPKARLPSSEFYMLTAYIAQFPDMSVFHHYGRLLVLFG